MKKLAGVYETTKKDGSVYYRSSVTYKRRHISLGSYENAQSAHLAYRLALSVLEPDSPITIETLSQLYRTESASLEKSKKNIAKFDSLPFEKAVCLLNFRDNGIYFSSPIYLKKSFFYYYLTPEITLLFDKETRWSSVRGRIRNADICPVPLRNPQLCCKGQRLPLPERRCK